MLMIKDINCWISALKANTSSDMSVFWLKRNFSKKRIQGEISRRKKPLEAALKKYPDRIHIANTTRWYEDPDEVMEGVFNFLGLEWRSEYLTMAALNAKRVSGSVMSKAFDTKKGISKEVSSLFA